MTHQQRESDTECGPQERLKKTNKLVKKHAKSNGGGSAGKDAANGEGSAHRAEKSSPNLKALLRGLSGGRSGGSGGTSKEPCSRSGECPSGAKACLGNLASLVTEEPERMALKYPFMSM